MKEILKPLRVTYDPESTLLISIFRTISAWAALRIRSLLIQLPSAG